MNDDELNMMLARNDGEIQIFRHMDIQREREALEAWRARGHRGKPPQPLVQLDELPECYRTDEPFEVTVLDESMEGRGQRRRNVVSYTDGLSDEQWAMVSPTSLSLLPSFISAFISRLWKKVKIWMPSQNALGAEKRGGRPINCSRMRKHPAEPRQRPMTLEEDERTRKVKPR
jgi:hypothetical protein